jgi:hypothetical protein
VPQSNSNWSLLPLCCHELSFPNPLERFQCRGRGTALSKSPSQSDISEPVSVTHTTSPPFPSYRTGLMGKLPQGLLPGLVLWLVGAAPALSEQEHPHPFRRLLGEKTVPGQNIGGESLSGPS